MTRLLKRSLLLSVLLAGIATPALAAGWTAGGNSAIIPASIDGAKLDGAGISCASGPWLMTLTGADPALTDGATVALGVDGTVFLTRHRGGIVIPPGIIAPLKSGKRFSVFYPADDRTLETVFPLKGSSKALDTLLEACGAPQAVTADAEDSSPSGGGDEPGLMGTTLKVPEQVSAGAHVVIGYTGPNLPGDWVGITKERSNENAFINGAFEYTRDGAPARMTAPSTPGTYEVRYVAYEQKKILHAKQITVTEPATASMETPATAFGGHGLEIKYSGPDGGANFIQIVKPSEPANKYASGHQSNLVSSIIRLRMPMEPGGYEIRYVLGAGEKTVVARNPITISAPPPVKMPTLEVEARKRFAIDLADAPRFHGDYIYIARKDEPPKGHSGGLTSVSTDGETTMSAPKEPGEWELRYVVQVASDYHILGHAPLTVK
ncbi:MAG: hypothetical protein KDK75_07980 [Alphaproteobacteria bacterium]|nr:hypothetical protein [Alphaproteobacteria bacterium]